MMVNFRYGQISPDSSDLLYITLTMTDFTLHFSCCFTKLLHSFDILSLDYIFIIQS